MIEKLDVSDKPRHLTFRTEMAGDNERVPLLLEVAGCELVNQQEISDPLMKAYKMGLYTIMLPAGVSLKEFHKKFITIIDSDERFVDMHRCWQTLNLGDEPNEDWGVALGLLASMDTSPPLKPDNRKTIIKNAVRLESEWWIDAEERYDIPDGHRDALEKHVLDQTQALLEGKYAAGRLHLEIDGKSYSGCWSYYRSGQYFYQDEED